MAARRLPVIQTPPSGEDAEAAARPAWQWLLIGAGFVLAIFLPLSLLSVPLGVRFARWASSSSGLVGLLSALPVFVAFAFASWAAGAVVGRFALSAPPRTAPLAGALGAALLVLVVLTRGAAGPLLMLSVVGALLLASGAGFAGLGARFGKRRRPGVVKR